MKKVYLHTQALCNECKEKVVARIVNIEGNVYLEKMCPEHGTHKSLLFTDPEWFEKSINYVKPREYPLVSNVQEFKGCPDSCGFCPEHQQHTCLPVIEITDLCDMDCPICLKDFDNLSNFNLENFKATLELLERSEKNTDVVNISGGEPTVHPDFEEMINVAKQRNITQISVSTNGLRLLKDQTLRHFFKETGIIAALQFDGFESATYKTLRGKDYSKEKLKLIDIFEKEELNYSLVATVASEINEHEIESITDFFFKSNALSLMFQPLAFTGGAKKFDIDRHRIDIAQVVKQIEKSQFVNKGDFNPLPCSHYSCFALSYYIKGESNEYHSLKEFLGETDYLNAIANKTLPGLDSDGIEMMKNKIYELWSASDSSMFNDEVLKRIKNTIIQLNSCACDRRSSLEIGMKNMKAIFIHHFMDEYNFDFGRLVKCCNPYPKKDGRLIPICAQNVFHDRI